MAIRQAKPHIGTSGFSYKKWHGKFYPADVDKGHLLSYYAQHFDTIEINRSFYRMLQPTTIEKWLNEVPQTFIICPKVSRYITHNKKLLDSPTHIEIFLKTVDALGPQKGPVLLQLPPNLKPQYGRLEEALNAFTSRRGSQRWRVAVEVRNDAWYGEELDNILDRYDASLVVHDMPAGRNGRPNPGASFVYMRFHGPNGDYRGEYGYKGLEKSASEIQQWLGKGKTVYAFFNNDADGFAPFDAKILKDMVDR